MTAPSLRVGSFLLTALVAYVDSPAVAALQPADCNRPIAHVRHNDIHFSVSIDRSDNRVLVIIAPAKEGTTRVPIRIALRLRDESVVEGSAEMQPSLGSGGYVDWRYRFNAKRPVTISGIFSVTIWVGDQMFDVLPW